MMTDTMSEPWYRGGLRFECTRCGNCCTGEPGFVWVNDTEIRQIAEYLGQPVEEFTQLQTRPTFRGRSLREKANNDCVFWDRQRGCTIYPVRPIQCRTWPFWESNLRTEDDWQLTRQKCPGAGQGELIPVEEITRRIKEIPI
jgi:Fe-S-cluster containining protein